MRKYTFCLLLTAIMILPISSCKTSRSAKSGGRIPMVECDSLFFDLEEGKLNAVSPLLSQDEIKEWLPCYTSIEPNGSNSECGGGVFYKNHGFTYYTYFDFLEVTEDFKGKTTHDLMGKSRDEVRKIYGQPKEMKAREGFENIDVFEKPYGCLRLSYKGNKVNSIAAHFTDCDAIEVCR